MRWRTYWGLVDEATELALTARARQEAAAEAGERVVANWWGTAAEATVDHGLAVLDRDEDTDRAWCPRSLVRAWRDGVQDLVGPWAAAIACDHELERGEAERLRRRLYAIGVRPGSLDTPTTQA